MGSYEKYKVLNSIRDINESQWKTTMPFESYQFFKGLEDCLCVGGNSGWKPRYYTNDKQDAFLYFFEKENSYGEYIFDWNWANAYHQSGIHYYPKMTSMVPFSPVTVSHLIGDNNREDEARELISFYHQQFLIQDTMSSHLLFISQQEKKIFESMGYLIRESFQYHFKNENYEGFEGFLNTLKNRKAKQIRKERQSLDNIKITKYSGDSIEEAHAERMFSFYMNTIHLKGAIPYLNLCFFKHLFNKLKKNIVYVEATEAEQPIAGSLFFVDDSKVYGRYWGAKKNIKNLHFELCYYQGIDILIDNNLDTFEAGAGGEHKISRGFRPIRTYSAHFMKGDQFQTAISQFIEKEKEYITQTIRELESYLPFR